MAKIATWTNTTSFYIIHDEKTRQNLTFAFVRNQLLLDNGQMLFENQDKRLLPLWESIPPNHFDPNTKYFDKERNDHGHLNDSLDDENRSIKMKEFCLLKNFENNENDELEFLNSKFINYFCINTKPNLVFLKYLEMIKDFDFYPTDFLHEVFDLYKTIMFLKSNNLCLFDEKTPDCEILFLYKKRLCFQPIFLTKFSDQNFQISLEIFKKQVLEMVKTVKMPEFSLISTELDIWYFINKRLGFFIPTKKPTWTLETFRMRVEQVFEHVHDDVFIREFEKIIFDEFSLELSSKQTEHFDKFYETQKNV